MLEPAKAPGCILGFWLRKGNNRMREEFVGENIEPVHGTIAAAATGAPGLPGKFVWRDIEYSALDVLQTWKETSRCTHGSGEKYVSKHWFKIKVDDGRTMKIYFERQARRGSGGKRRWRLYSIALPRDERETSTGSAP